MFFYCEPQSKATSVLYSNRIKISRSKSRVILFNFCIFQVIFFLSFFFFIYYYFFHLYIIIIIFFLYIKFDERILFRTKYNTPLCFLLLYTMFVQHYDSTFVSKRYLWQPYCTLCKVYIYTRCQSKFSLSLLLLFCFILPQIFSCLIKTQISNSVVFFLLNKNVDIKFSSFFLA